MNLSHVLQCSVLSSLRGQSKCRDLMTGTIRATKSRRLSTKRETKKLKIIPKPPPEGVTDFIGPPDPKSNIRPIRFYIPPDETPTEKAFRLQRAEVLAWNQNFWAEHNSKFFQEKDDYIQRHQTEEEDGKKRSLSPEQMSVFYKKFLDENRIAHLHYNKEWYKKNISLLWPALKVALIRLRRKLQKR